MDTGLVQNYTQNAFFPPLMPVILFASISNSLYTNDEVMPFGGERRASKYPASFESLRRG